MIVRIRPFLDAGRVVSALAHAENKNIALVEEFEKAFASYIGAPRAIAVHQGRSALLLALKVLDIKKGDEVIVQSYIFHVVVDAILELGAKPVLVDSNLCDFNISVRSIEREITPRTKAIIVTHLGVPCDMEEITAIAREHKCFLIENCAHTFGAQYNGKNVGTFGDLSFYSFDVDKPISTGDGGMLVINNAGLLETAGNIIKQYKRTPLEKDEEIVYGLILQHLVSGEGIYPQNGFLPVDFGKNVVKNDGGLVSLMKKSSDIGKDEEVSRHIMPYLRQQTALSEEKTPLIKRIASRVRGRANVMLGRTSIRKIDSGDLLMNYPRCAVGLEALADFETAREVRNRNARFYRDALDGAAYEQPGIDERKRPAFIRYTVLNNTKYENSFIAAAAREKGFELGIFNWSSPIHLCYPYNRLIDFDRDRLRNSEYLGKKMFSLPVHPYVGEGDVKKIARFLNDLAG